MSQQIQHFKGQDKTTASQLPAGGSVTKYNSSLVFPFIASIYLFKKVISLNAMFVIIMFEDIFWASWAIYQKKFHRITHEIPEGANQEKTTIKTTVQPDNVETQPIDILNQSVPSSPPVSNSPTLPTAVLREQYQGTVPPTEPMPSDEPAETPAAMNGETMGVPGNAKVRFVDISRYVLCFRDLTYSLLTMFQASLIKIFK